MVIETIDPNTVILEEDKDKQYVIYQDLQSGERWIIEGECNCCGLCAIGENNPFIIWSDGIKPGQPSACFDIRKPLGLRKDVPIRPEGIDKSFNENGNCVFRGRYLT